MLAEAHVISWLNNGCMLWAKRYEWALKEAGPDKQKKALEELSYFVKRRSTVTQQYLVLLYKM